MCKKLVLFAVLLALTLGSSVQAINIVWVAEGNVDAAGVPYDQGWIDLLTAEGYTVDDQRDWGTLDAAKLDTLEAADLIIVSRTTNSGNYATDATEVTQWNSVTTPLILQTGYIIRTNRWQWMNTTNVSELVDETMMQVADAAHPIFSGVGVTDSQVDVIDASVDSGQATFSLFGEVGNGNLIATRADDSSVWIAEWEAGVNFYDGTDEVAGGKRMYFAGAGGGGGQTAGSMNFTPEGQKLWLNAVAYMLGLDLDPGRAGAPVPATGQSDVLRDTVLSWQPGEGAVAHDVYLGTTFADVNDATRDNPLDVLVSQGQSPATLESDVALDFGQTYYWRVDEWEAGGATMHKGAVWSFSTENYSYLVPDVNVTASVASAADPNALVNDPNANGTSMDADTMWNASPGDASEIVLDFDLGAVYRLDEMRVWNFNLRLEGLGYLNFSVKDIAVESSIDGETWTPLGDHTLAQGTGSAENPGQPVKLENAAAQYVRLIAKNTYGGTNFGLSEVHFYYIPTKASKPEPVSGTEDLDPAITLSWRSGREAASHRVYLDTDPNAVADEATSFTTSNTNMLDLGVLDLGQTYYWKVVEVNDAEVPAAWSSDVWNLATTAFISVDDFESYTDNPGEEVFNVWPDGYGIGNNGSQVTYDNPPYMETTIVHGGDQSMPYYYGKDGAANSEATMDVGGANWTYGNAKTLVLYVHGDPENDPAQLYVKIGTTRIDYPGDPAGLTAPLWKQWNIDLSGLSVSRVTSLTIGVDGPGSGLLFIDDIRLYRDAPAMPDPAVDPGQTGLQAYYPMNNSLADASGNSRAGVAEAGTGFGEGPIGYGQALTLDGTDTAYVTIPVGSVIQASDSMTVAAWVSRASTGANQRVFDFGNDTDVYMFLAPSSGAGVRFAITTGSNGAESEVVSDGPIPADGSWHHVAITIDGATGQMNLYVDGGLADTATTETLPSDLGSTANNWISRSQWSADPYLEGAIDEFRIYDRALSDAEVRYLVGDR